MIRAHKILPILVPAFLITLSLIALYYIGFTKFMANQVIFDGPAAALSQEDKRAIRHLVLADKALAHPRPLFKRHKVD